MKRLLLALCFSLTSILVLTGLTLHKRGQKEPILLVVAAITPKNPVKGLVHFYLKKMAKVNWNEAEHEGESMFNLLISNCLDWAPACQKTAEIMLSQGADINLLSKGMGVAPIHTAVASNNLGAAKFLVEHGANASIHAAEAPMKGMTPLELGENVEKTPKEVLEYLRTVLPATPAVNSPQL